MITLSLSVQNEYSDADLLEYYEEIPKMMDNLRATGDTDGADFDGEGFCVQKLEIAASSDDGKKR